MNVYIFLILAIVIAILFILKKEKIKEGLLEGMIANDISKCDLDYCNNYTDLKDVLCAGNDCTTAVHAEKCRNHWFEYGKNEKRTKFPKLNGNLCGLLSQHGMSDITGDGYINDCNDYTSTFGPYKSGNGQWLANNCSIGYQNVMNNCSHNNTCSTISDYHKRKACNIGFDLGKYKQLTKELKAIKKLGYIELVGNECVIPSKGRKIDIKDSQGKDLIFTRDYTLEFEINPGPIADEQVNGKDWRNIFSRVYDESPGWPPPRGSRVPAIFFWPKDYQGKTGNELYIRVNTKDQNGNFDDGINTKPLPENKWTKVSITLKDNKLSYILSGDVIDTSSKTVISEGTDAKEQYYYRQDMPCKLYLGVPTFYSTNAKIRNMKWTNHPDKRCFAKLPTGCANPLGELNKFQHTEYQNKSTGWIEGGWNWTGTDDDCNNNRKKAFNDHCIKNDAMTVVSDKKPKDNANVGWIGLSPKAEPSSGIVIRQSEYPQCEQECRQHRACNNIRWVKETKKCDLLKSGVEQNKEDTRWRFSKLWENFRGMGKKEGFKNPKNVTEHSMVDKGFSWSQVKAKCEEKSQNMATRAEILGFLKKKHDGNSWTPVADGNNEWLQVGQRKSNVTASSQGTSDYGLLYKEIDDVKNATGLITEEWRNRDKLLKYYCSGAYETSEQETKMNTCPENCAKPTKITGNCASGNPIETTDGKYYKQCPYTCLGPQDTGYKDIGPKDSSEKYDVNSHGCRTSTQCLPCGNELVETKGKFVEQNVGGVIKRFFVESPSTSNSFSSSSSTTSSDSSKYKCNAAFNEQQGFPCVSGKCYDAGEKCDKNEVCKSGCCNDSKCVYIPESEYKSRDKLDEFNRRFNELMGRGGESKTETDDETVQNIQSNQQNIADTSQGNMFTDITNANDIGMMDMSLDDYYKRRLLNNSTENRLGGSNAAMKYIKKMPRDNNGKVSFFNSVWTLFN